MKLSEHLKPTLAEIKAVCDQGKQAKIRDVKQITGRASSVIREHFKMLVDAGVLKKTHESFTFPAYYSLKIDTDLIEWVPVRNAKKPAPKKKRVRISEPKWKPPVRYSSVWDYAAQIKRSTKK